MFAKLAQFRSPRPITAHSGESHDRYSARFSFASAPRLRRPVLVCRWVERRSGALECTWHVEASEISTANEPVNRPRFRQSRGSHQLGVVGKQPTRSAAA
jgi:hypothetical protein